jgi:hypothetical protein
MPTCIRLTDYKSSEEKEKGFFKPENRYEAKQEDFEKIPGSPIAYWVSDKVVSIFEKSQKLGSISEIKQGLKTGDNDVFLKRWQEINFNNIGMNYNDISETENCSHKWYPYNKGGEFRKWYGNNEYLVNWFNNGYEIRNFYDDNGRQKSRPQNIQYFFKQSITWTAISSSNFGVRFCNNGFIFDGGGSSAFINQDIYQYIGALLISKIAYQNLKILSPTISFEIGHIKAIPILFPKQDSIKQQIETLTQQNINISKEEWDSRETSWDFAQNEILRIKNEELKIENGKIEDVYNAYCDYWREKFYKLHKNEEELNRLFIEIYGLEDELTPDVPLEDITILKKEAKIIDNELVFQADEIMKQFISYAVGVMFGRYSLDSEGLLIANMNQEVPKSTTFEIDDDNVIPVLEDDYFSDDIASRFIQFVKKVFGEEHLRENIQFIEKSLGTTLRK